MCPAFPGTVRWTANLGIPDLSALTSGAGQSIAQGGFDPTTLLSGSHDVLPCGLREPPRSAWRCRGR